MSVETVISPPAGEVQVTFRVGPELAERLDALAQYIGMGRSGFLRLAVVNINTRVTLAELDRLGESGALTEDARRIQEEAMETDALIGEALEPRTLPLGRMN